MDLIYLAGFVVGWSSKWKRERKQKEKRTEKENRERESKLGNILIIIFCTAFPLIPLTNAFPSNLCLVPFQLTLTLTKPNS